MLKEYDSRGFEVSLTDRSGAVTQTSYDAAGRASSVTSTGSGTESYTWDDVGRLSRMVNSRGAETVIDVDELGRLTEVERDDGSVVQLEYSALGTPAVVRDGIGREMRQESDGAGRVKAVVHADGGRDEYDYDQAGNLVVERNPLGHERTYMYDSRARLIDSSEASGATLSFAYDEMGNMVSVTNGRGSTTRWEHNMTGQRTKRVLPMGQTSTWAYEDGLRVTSSVNARGQEIVYTYDSTGLVTRIDLPDGTFEEYTHTASDLVETITNDLGTTTLSYDQKNRLVQKTDHGGRSISFSYDTRGNRTSVTTPSGTTSYSYDMLDRLVAATDPAGGVTTFAWDAADQLTELSYANGVRELRTYSDRGRLQSVELRDGTDMVVASRIYEFDTAARVTAVTQLGGRRSEFQYDAADQLILERIVDGATVETIYTYDEVGNRVSKQVGADLTLYDYDANNRLLSDGSFNYQYDADGNLIERSNASRTERFSYDALSRLVAVETTEGTTTSEVQYQYTGSTRVRRTEGGVQADYLVDSARRFSSVLEEVDAASGASIASYSYGIGLLSQDRGGARHFYHHDEIGSVRRLTNAAGSISDVYDYDPFGADRGATGTTANPYRFAGMRREDVSGIYNFRARDLLPELGRFLQLDPASGDPRKPLTANGYIYAENDPFNKVDPTGMFSIGLPEINITNAIIATIATASVLNAVLIETGTHPFLWGKSPDADLPDSFTGMWYQMSSSVDVGLGSINPSLRTIVSGAWGAPVAVRHRQLSVGLSLLDTDTLQAGAAAAEGFGAEQAKLLAGSSVSGGQAMTFLIMEVLKDFKVTPTGAGLSLGISAAYVSYAKNDLAWLSAGLGASAGFGSFGIGLGAEVAVGCPTGDGVKFGPAFSVGASVGVSTGASQAVGLDATVTWSVPTDHSDGGWCS